MPPPKAARARRGHLTPVVYVVLLEHARGAIVGLAPDADRALDLLGRVALQQHEVPELGLEWATGQGQPQPEDAVREDRVIAQLHPARTECAEPPLDLRHCRFVVLLEQPQRLARHAVHEAGGVVVSVAEGDRMPVDKGVLVWARELVFVGQRWAAEPA